MSEYCVVETEFKDKQVLLDSLKELGYVNYPHHKGGGLFLTN